MNTRVGHKQRHTPSTSASRSTWTITEMFKICCHAYLQLHNCMYAITTILNMWYRSGLPVDVACRADIRVADVAHSANPAAQLLDICDTYSIVNGYGSFFSLPSDLHTPTLWWIGSDVAMASKYTLWSGHKKINAEIPVYSLTSLIFIAALFDHITFWWVYGNIVRHRVRFGSWSVSNTISGCILNTQSDALVHVIRFLNLILRDPVGIPF